MKYAAALLLSLLPLLAQALESGDTLAPWTLLDQYDQPYSPIPTPASCWWHATWMAQSSSRPPWPSSKGYLQSASCCVPC